MKKLKRFCAALITLCLVNSIVCPAYGMRKIIPETRFNSQGFNLDVLNLIMEEKKIHKEQKDFIKLLFANLLLEKQNEEKNFTKLPNYEFHLQRQKGEISIFDIDELAILSIELARMKDDFTIENIKKIVAAKEVKVFSMLNLESSVDTEQNLTASMFAAKRRDAQDIKNIKKIVGKEDMGLFKTIMSSVVDTQGLAVPILDYCDDRKIGDIAQSILLASQGSKEPANVFSGNVDMAKYEEWLDSAFRGTIPITRIKNEITGAIVPAQRENRLRKLFARIKSEEDLKTARSIARMVILLFESEKKNNNITVSNFKEIFSLFQQTAEEAGIGFSVHAAGVQSQVNLEFLASRYEPLVKISTDKLANIAQIEQIAGELKELYIDARLLFDKQGNLQVVGLENIFAKLNDLLGEEISEADRHIKIVVPRDAGDMWATLKKFGERYDFLEIVHESDAIKSFEANTYLFEKKTFKRFAAVVSEKEYSRMIEDENDEGDEIETWSSFIPYDGLIKMGSADSAKKEISLILLAIVSGLDLLADGEIDNAEELLREHYQDKIIAEAEVDKIVKGLQRSRVKKFPAVKPMAEELFEGYQRQLEKEQEALKES